PYIGIIILGVMVMGLLVISIPALVIYLIVRFKGRDPLITEPRRPVKWTLGDVLKSVAVFILLSFFIRAIITAVLTLAPPSRKLIAVHRLDFHLGSQIITEFLLILFCIYLVVEVRGGSLAQLGLTSSHFFKNIFRGFSGYVIAAPVLVVMLIFSNLLVERFGEPPDIKIIMEFLSPQYGFRHVLSGFLMIAVIAPVAEEIFFRGFLQGALRRRLSFWPAIIISALFFALLHFRFAAGPFLFTFGLLLGYLYEKTQSLIPVITVHLVHNSIISFYTIFVLLL
ncbi:MAG: CPBP family intramembrane glutamic endopeptidase, partial [Planctomycetota bacterium]